MALPFKYARGWSDPRVAPPKQFGGTDFNIGEELFKRGMEMTELERMGQSSDVEAYRDAARRQDMGAPSPGSWYRNTSGTSATFTGCTTKSVDLAISREDALRMKSAFWEREYSMCDDKTVWKLNHRMVHERLVQLGSTVPESKYYHIMRSDSSEFDRMFGPGAHKAYRETLADPHAGEAIYGPDQGRPTKKVDTKPKLPETHKLPLNMPFSRKNGRSLNDQLMVDHRAVEQDTKTFYVTTHETLLEALRRNFDVWTKGAHISAVGGEAFTMQDSGGIIFSGATTRSFV